MTVIVDDVQAEIEPRPSEPIEHAQPVSSTDEAEHVPGEAQRRMVAMLKKIQRQQRRFKAY